MMIPEAQEALRYKGSRAAIPLLQRAQDICGGAYKPGHPLASHATFELAIALELVGDHRATLDILTGLSKVDESPAVSRALALTYLKLDDPGQAAKLAWQAFDRSNAADPVTTDTTSLGEALHVSDVLVLALLLLVNTT
jgi:hypothetical protein